MINRPELKELSKSQLKGKWGNGVLLTFVYLLICGAFQIPTIGPAASIVLAGPLMIGFLIAFINLVKNGSKLEVSDLFKGFNNFAKSLGIYWWNVLWIFLWMLLLVVPGIIKALAYSQSFYIIADNPTVNVKDALKVSIKMTNGYKGDIFVMGLSFLGWFFLGCLSLGIGFLWIIPYMNTTYVNMFYKLKELSIQKGVCTEAEFGGAPSAPSQAPGI